MKKTVFAMFCMTASMVWAQDSDKTRSEELEKVDLRVSVLEEINVTADKTTAVPVDEADTDIDEILRDAEAIEDDLGGVGPQ